jgi:uncharacterized membrane protein YcaP (DUF421 family)
MREIVYFFDQALGLDTTQASQLSTGQVCARAVVSYIVLIAYVRFGKKRFLSRATAFDAILVIVIGSIGSRAISGTAPFLPSLAGTFTLIAMHWVISFFGQRSNLVGFLTKGRSTTLIRNGSPDLRAMRAAHISEDDLLEDLREKGVRSPAEVEEARLERSGKLSVLKKHQ